MHARTFGQPARWPRPGRLAATGIFGLLVWFAACTNLDDLTEPDCDYTVTPATIDVGNQGGTGTLAIRAPGVCAWTVENSAGWVSLTGEQSGNGNGNLGYAVATHEGFDYRYATLTVAGKSVAVSQAGRPLPPVCSYSVSPTATSAPATGGPGSIAVAAPAGCEWAATSLSAWLTITSGASGSGSGAFGFVVAANTTTTARAGSMSAGGHLIGVTQAAGGPPPPPPNCSYTISPTSADFPTAGGTRTISVTAQAGCPWTAVAQQTWITILAGSSGSGNGQVLYAVAPCGCGDDRSGRIVVAGRNFNIDQDGGNNTPALSGVLPAGR